MVDVRLKQVLQSDNIGFLAIGASTTASAAGDLSSGDGSTDLAFTASTGLLNVGSGHLRVGTTTAANALGDISASDGTRVMHYDASVNWLRMSGATAIIGSTSAHDLQLTYNESVRLILSNNDITSYRQVNWAPGLGSLTHLLGPSDQPFTIQPGAAQGLTINSADGTTALQINNTNNINFQQVTWNDSVGAITHLLGPSDQPFTLQPGASQELIVNAQDGTAYLTLSTTGSPNNYATVNTGSFRLADDVELIFGTGADAYLGWSTLQTGGNTLVLGLSSTAGSAGSASLVVTTRGNYTQDHDHGDDVDPTIYLHSAVAPNTDNTEWASLSTATGGAFGIDTGDAAHAINLGTGGNVHFTVGDGTTTLTRAANGETATTQYNSAVVDFSVSGTATGLIPAGALVLSVTTRVLTTISGGGATDYEVGDGTDTDRWGLGGALTAGTTTDPTDFTDNTIQFNASASAGDVVLTGVGGTPTAGTVRVTLAYMSFGAPTS